MRFETVVAESLKFSRVLVERFKRNLAPPAVSLSELLVGYWTSQMIIVAAKLEIAEALKEKPLSVGELAKRTRTHKDSLFRLMRGLVGMGIFIERSPGTFALNRMSRPLLKDSSDSIHSLCLLQGRDFHWTSWGSLDTAIRTGKPCIEDKYKFTLFNYLKRNPEDSKIFNQAMSDWTAQASESILNSFDFGRFDKVIDVGGGQGEFLWKMKKKHKNIKGIVFDKGQVKNIVSSTDQNSFQGKIRYAGKKKVKEIGFLNGDFFKTIPEGYDLYVLKNIVHDWSDQSAIQILKNCSLGMSLHSRLLIIETILPKNSSYHFGKLLDLEMLTVTDGGKERTILEIESLARQSGLEIVKVHKTPAIESVVEIRRQRGN